MGHVHNHQSHLQDADEMGFKCPPLGNRKVWYLNPTKTRKRRKTDQQVFQNFEKQKQNKLSSPSPVLVLIVLRFSKRSQSCIARRDGKFEQREGEG